MTRVGIINYSCGNIRSIVNALEYLQLDYHLISTPEQLKCCRKAVLPGVGHFDHAVSSLHQTGLFDAIIDWAGNPTNTLFGICLGMQLLCSSSSESSKGLCGLGLINAEVCSFRDELSSTAKVPHIGWNTVTFDKSFELIEHKNKMDMYFLHSYFVRVRNSVNSLAKTFYEGLEYDSAITNRTNIIGYQFHPEKSHIAGLQLLKAFVDA